MYFGLVWGGGREGGNYTGVAVQQSCGTLLHVWERAVGNSAKGVLTSNIWTKLFVKISDRGTAGCAASSHIGMTGTNLCSLLGTCPKGNTLSYCWEWPECRIPALIWRRQGTWSREDFTLSPCIAFPHCLPFSWPAQSSLALPTMPLPLSLLLCLTDFTSFLPPSLARINSSRLNSLQKRWVIAQRKTTTISLKFQDHTIQKQRVWLQYIVLFLASRGM